MKIPFRWLVVMGMILQLLASTVDGGTKNPISKNQLKAEWYISELKTGANPDSLKRPVILRQGEYKSRERRQELYDAMDEAEDLARAGKRHLIQEP